MSRLKRDMKVTFLRIKKMELEQYSTLKVIDSKEALKKEKRMD